MSKNPRTVTCATCGRDFTTHHNASKYCSEICVYLASGSNPVTCPLQCEVCGSLIKRQGVGPGRHKHYCSDRCRHMAKANIGYVTSLCRVCGTAMRDERREFCSDECERVSKQAPSLPAQVCDVCGAHFIPRNVQHKRCSPECAAEIARRRLRHKPRRVNEYGPDRECEMCGATYTPRYKDQRTCGRECGRFLVKGYGRTVLVSERLHGQHSELMVCASCGDLIPRRHPGATYCEACSGTANLGGTWIRGVKVCEDCGVPILVYKGSGNKCGECADAIKRDRARAEKRDHKRRYGSHCHKSRARKYGCYYEPVNRFEVFERDHWTCHICGKPIPWGTAPSSPMSPTIDHVWPMSKGGPHSYENVRAAHMICNSRKSDSTYLMGYTACHH